MTKTSPNSPPSSRLSRFGPRVIAHAREDARTSRLVAFLRWFLPLSVLGGLGLLVLWPHFDGSDGKKIIAKHIPNLMIEKVSLTGRDAENQAYALTAARALAVSGLKNVVDLESPQGKIALKDGMEIEASAALGRFDQKTEKLWLGQRVEIRSDRGHFFTTDELFADLPKAAVWSKKPVDFQWEYGKMSGAGFRALEGGKIIVFEGPARASLYFNEKSGEDKPSVKDSEAR